MTLTKENLIAQAEGNITMLRASLEYVKDPFERDDISTDLRLAEIALAALTAEPVAWIVHARSGDQLTADGDYVANAEGMGGIGSTPLYRTAPPAPVSVPAAMEMDDDFDSAFEHGKAVGWNAYRAAMLKGGAGNSPAIPDGWTGSDAANAALIMLDRIETVDSVDDDRIEGIKSIIRGLAAAPQQEV